MILISSERGLTRPKGTECQWICVLCLLVCPIRQVRVFRVILTSNAAIVAMAVDAEVEVVAYMPAMHTKRPASEVSGHPSAAPENLREQVLGCHPEIANYAKKKHMKSGLKKSQFICEVIIIRTTK